MGADIPTWAHMLWTYRREISWRFIPKIFVITFMVLLYAPLRWWEKLCYQRRIKATEVKPPIFIIGHQRSGTTYLHYLLGRDPQFGYLSIRESFMPWIILTSKKHIAWILDRKVPDKRPMDNLKLGADLPTEPEYALANMTWATMIPGYYFPKRMYEVFQKYVLFKDPRGKKAWQGALRYFLQKLTLKNSGKQLIIKSPECLGRVKEILEVFPNAKFIHIHRDPYRVYFSTMRLYGITIPMVAMQYCERETVRQFVLNAYRDMFTKFFADKELIPKGNLSEIRYEEFIGHEMTELERAYQELGFSGFQQAEQSIRQELKVYEGYKTNTYDYDQHTMEEVFSEWQPIFEQLGYSK